MIVLQMCFFCKQKTAYELRISDWSSDVCSSDLLATSESACDEGIPLFEANGHVRSLDELEADIIRIAIRHYRGQMSEVARRLGIGRSTLYRKLAELGIERGR